MSYLIILCVFFFFSSRRRHTRCSRDWSSDVCSSDLLTAPAPASKKALDKAKLGVKDVGLWEINEAFAVIPLDTMRRLGIDRSEERRVGKEGRSRWSPYH